MMGTREHVGQFGPLVRKEDDQLLCGEASFAVNLFLDGFSVGRSTEEGKAVPLGYEVMETLYPYDRTSEDFLRVRSRTTSSDLILPELYMAIDGGWLPDDLLEDIPCSYVDGCVICELRDYRDSIPSDSVYPVSPWKGLIRDWVPAVWKVLLQPSTETIIKDVASMADETWTYKDLLEVEARILRAVQPPLCLDPTPAVARKAYIANFNKLKFNIGFHVLRRYRMPPEARADRHQRLAATAAARALSEIGKVSKLQKMGHEKVSNMSTRGSHIDQQGGQDAAPAPLSPGSWPPKTRPGVTYQQVLGMPSQGSSLQISKNPSGLSFTPAATSISPGVPSSPSSSAPTTPTTTSTVTSANGSGCFAGDMKLGSASPILGKRETNEFATAAQAEGKKFKMEQVKAGNYEQHQQDAKQFKDLHGEDRLQQQQQPEQQRSSHSTLQQLMSETQHFPQEIISHSDLKVFNQGDYHPLYMKTMEFETSKAIQEKHDKPEKFAVERAKAGMDVKKEPDNAEQLSAPSFSSPGVSGNLDTMLPSPQFSGLSVQACRDPSNSLPNMYTAPTPNNLLNSLPSPSSVVNSPTGIASLQRPSIKAEQGLPVQSGSSQSGMVHSITGHGQRKLSIDTQAALLQVINRFKLHDKQKSQENLSAPNKNRPSFQLLSVALSDNTSDDYKEVKGHRSMAKSLVGGNINTRKTRFLQFSKTDRVPQGPGCAPLLVCSRTRLVLCGRGKDTMVEAVVQMSDDQDEEAQQFMSRHHVLPTLANPEKADLFAVQYATLMEKEGWELVEDEVQAAISRGASAMANAATNARPMPAGATTLRNAMGNPASLSRILMNQQHIPSLPGTPVSLRSQMQPPSPSALAASRMPPPATSSRPVMGNHLGQQGAGKPMQMDSQLAPAQQQHPLQHHQQLQLQQQQSQRPQQLIATQQLVGQLTNAAQQIPHVNQLQQLQFFQQQHQQRQQQQNLLQRKMMLPGAMSSVGMNMSNGNKINGVGLPLIGGSPGGLGSVVGLSGMKSVITMGGVTGMGNSMGGMSGLTTVGQLPVMANIGQVGGVGNMMSQQLRPGHINQAHAAALASKRLAAGRVPTAASNNPPIRSMVDNSQLAATNQLHATQGMPISGQSIARNGLSPVQRAPITGISLPTGGASVITAGISEQGYYLNQQQLNPQSAVGSLVGGPPSPQMSVQGLESVTGLPSSGLDVQSLAPAGTLAAVAAAVRSQVRRPMMPSHAQTQGQPSQQ